MLSSNWLVAPRFWGLLAVAVLAAAVCANRPALANSGNNTIKSYHLDSHSQRIDVPVVLHKSETVRTDFPFGDAMVGDPEIADVVPLTNQSIYILGKKPGVTRLSLLDAKKQVLGVVDIEVTYDLDLMRRTLLDQSRLFENQGVVHERKGSALRDCSGHPGDAARGRTCRAAGAS